MDSNEMSGPELIPSLIAGLPLEERELLLQQIVGKGSPEPLGESKEDRANDVPAGAAEIICVVDRSGSMGAIRDDAIGGFNQFVEEQRRLPGAVRLTLALFDHEYDLVYDAVPLAEAPPLDESTYVPRGTTPLRCLVAGALLGFLLGSAPVRAQLIVEPQGLTVMLPQDESETRTVTLRSIGSEPLSFCLSFDRPLQRAEGSARLSADALGSACGAYGEVLFSIDQEGLPGCCADASGLAMTPDGRLFAAEFHTDITYELDAALGYVRMFDHPMVNELAPFPVTTGVTYNVDTGTLWWLNIEEYTDGLRRALLLEGDLNGVPTGRRIELPIGAPDVPPDERASPVGLAYAAARGWFYYTDIRSETIWAVDALGSVVDGYPVQPEAYPGASLAFGLDAHPSAGGTDAPSVRLELYVRLSAAEGTSRRLAVVDPLGGDLGAGRSLETPLPPENPNAEPGLYSGEPVRSRLDPNGVLYYPWSTFENSGVLAIRPHPLPPSWLVVEGWDGTLPPGESREIALTFRPGERAVGNYTATLQAFTAETGEAVEVPLTLEVTPGTVSEEEPAEEPESSSLSVYPNPLGENTEATVALTLDTASETRVVVYDVLGRAVATLHAGELRAGEHAFSLDGRALPAGLYLVRVESGGRSFTERVTVVR